MRVVIPARYASTRFPGKVLKPIAGKPLLEHVYARAVSSGAEVVIIATDDERVVEAASRFGADTMLTSADHRSGTDRVAEVARQRGWTDDVPIVNVQGDAPLIPPGSIRQAAALLEKHDTAQLATLCVDLDGPEQYRDPNIVKVVCDAAGRALYFSRAAIPSDSHGAAQDSGWSAARRHIGLYAYRASALERLTGAEPCELERLERLEQLRALWLGMEIRVDLAAEQHGPDVDTEADLIRVEEILAADITGRPR